MVRKQYPEIEVGHKYGVFRVTEYTGYRVSPDSDSMRRRHWYIVECTKCGATSERSRDYLLSLIGSKAHKHTSACEKCRTSRASSGRNKNIVIGDISNVFGTPPSRG